MLKKNTGAAKAAQDELQQDPSTDSRLDDAPASPRTRNRRSLSAIKIKRTLRVVRDEFPDAIVDILLDGTIRIHCADAANKVRNEVEDWFNEKR